MAPFVQYAIAASEDALKDAGWSPSSDLERERTVCLWRGICIKHSLMYEKGVCIGSGIGNLDDIYRTSLEFAKSVSRVLESNTLPNSPTRFQGMRRLSPHFVPKILINLAAGQVAIRNGFMVCPFVPAGMTRN